MALPEESHHVPSDHVAGEINRLVPGLLVFAMASAQNEPGTPEFEDAVTAFRDTYAELPPDQHVAIAHALARHACKAIMRLSARTDES
ncbi:hypothetical protein [Microbacterium aerolatum]|uniref:hypothetical protein n=1 Tax=Microbacterium aerolatum TaxID=153731 RepID=UPI0038506A24